MKTRLVLFIIFTHVETWACSMAYAPPTKFDPDEYIFTGKVMGYVSSYGVQPKDVIGTDYYGFLIEIEDEVYVPEKPKKNYEIFPLSLGADCSEGPRSKYYVELFFPIGSTVRIVAKKAKIKFERSDKYNIQLVASPRSDYTLSINIDRIPSLISTKETVYQYENISQDSLHNFANRIADELNIVDTEKRTIISYSVLFQKDFELRKDLYRLYSSNNDTEKVKILFRLKNFKYLGPRGLLNIILTYVQSEIIRNKLFSSLFEFRDNVSTDDLRWIIGR